MIKSHCTYSNGIWSGFVPREFGGQKNYCLITNYMIYVLTDFDCFADNDIANETGQYLCYIIIDLTIKKLPNLVVNF